MIQIGYFISILVENQIQIVQTIITVIVICCFDFIFGLNIEVNNCKPIGVYHFSSYLKLVLMMDVAMKAYSTLLHMGETFKKLVQRRQLCIVINDNI